MLYNTPTNMTEFYLICSNVPKYLPKTLITLAVFASHFSIIDAFSLPQQEDSISLKTKNTPNPPVQSPEAKAFFRSTEIFENAEVNFQQRIVLENIRETVHEAKLLLRMGVDSVGFKEDLEEIEKQRILVEKGVSENEGHPRSDRNLALSGAIMSELSERTLSIRNSLKDKGDYLFRLSYLIDSLSGLEAIYILPSDSIEQAAYKRKLALVGKEVKPTVEDIKVTIYALESLESKANELLIHLQLTSLMIESEREELNRYFFKKEISELNSNNYLNRSFDEIVKISVEKEILAFLLFLEIYFLRITFMTSIIIFISIFIYNLKKRIIEEQGDEGLYNNYQVLKHPFLSSAIVSIGLFQFFFPSPPFIFYYNLWVLSGIALTFVFNRFLSTYWMKFWYVVFLFFILVGSLNMILIFSSFEKYAILLLSIIGLTYGMIILFKKKFNELKERKIVYFIYFLCLMQLLSIFFFIQGNLNLSKALLVSGYIGSVLGVIMIWTVRLINQMLVLASNTYNKPDKKLFFINFDKIGEKVPNIFYIFLVIGWLSLVGKNFYNFSNISTYLSDFLNTPRVLGSYTFTINSILVFLTILAVSFLLSRILSFFGSDPEIQQVNQKKRKQVSLGSWLLLVQIFVISLGLFLAIAASGVPLDKITIVLGALGVGIGLGLQGLFNNLVSGVIIAFENPVKVGDLIEINGKAGIMKSIGFRSSVVNMFEGSSIIIPNGELLSNQMVNWTMGKGKKLSFLVGVEYGTNLEKAVGLIKDIISKDKRILDYPVARVLPHEFADNQINLQVTFWCHNYFELPFLKGDIIMQIDETFKKEGVVIAFPQLDVHIKSGSDQLKPFDKNPHGDV
jgi:small-conductance mechanosensitive channel